MGKPTKLHDVQKLAGRIAALSRFVARLGEKALPSYALMKKSDDKFEWMEEADTAFTTEKVLSTPPVLVAPKEKEPLQIYIAATHQVVSTVLVAERSEEGKAHGVQRPVYFVSEVLSPTKQRYPHYQKLAYSVFTTAQKLQQYFVVHPIIVVNEAPPSNILNNPSATGCVSLWGIELSPLDIMYEKQKGNQITSPARFYSRVARTIKHRTTGFIKRMDNVLRQIKKGPRRRTRSGPDITTM
jgi:dsDNA-binding SOS-regulon protein